MMNLTLTTTPDNKMLIDPNSIPKFVNQLSIPPIFAPTICKSDSCFLYHKYNVSIRKIQAQVLPPGFPQTPLFAYGGLIQGNRCLRNDLYYHSFPGPTFEAIKGITNIVNWNNELTGSNPFPIDPTLHWADPNMASGNLPVPFPPFPPGFPLTQFPIPIVTHLHGGEDAPIYDGNPDAWYTFNGKYGKYYKTSCYKYPNTQPPTTLWYHDHVIGITRLNVYAGLAGLYIIRDLENPLDNPNTSPFPQGQYEIPLVIQDRSFYDNGSSYFPTVGNNPSIHPYWTPVFFGNTITVNGKVWPNLNVERRPYRFRILNASNSRFYLIKLSNNKPFIQIGSDGGYLPKPLSLSSLFISPAERFDVIIDFSKIPLNTKIVLQNFGAASYPFGNANNLKDTMSIMQFTVASDPPVPVKPLNLPERLNSLPCLVPNRPKRVLTLNAQFKRNNPNALSLLLDGQRFTSPVSECPLVGSTELWEFVNLTADAHPIHVHLVQFQLVNRQFFDVDSYSKVWNELNPNIPLSRPTIPVCPDKYLQGYPIPPDPNEIAWKDTIKAFPGQVTRILIRFAPLDSNPYEVQPGVNLYPFDPTELPGYAWHCHMLDHEDNDMMRPLFVIK